MAMTTNGMLDREQMNDRVRNGGSGMVYIPNGRVEEDESFVDERAPDPSAPGGDWDSLLNYQRRHQEAEQQKANQQILDGYLNIETAAKQRRVALNQNKAIAGAAAINSAYRNGGFSDPSLRESLSNAFGMPVYGGQIVDMGEGMGKSFVLYGAKSDPKTGEAQFAPVALLDDKSVLQVIKRANAGDAMNDAAKEFYASALSRYTPAQLSDFGVSRPGGPMVLGSAEIRSRGPRHSRVSASYFDGEGGYSRMDYDGWTGERQEVRGGTMSPEYPGRWKVLESGPNGKRYENDRTGEVVNVPDGSTLRDVLRGTSEKEKVAQINAQGRVDAASARAAGRAAGSKTSEAPSYNKDQYADLKTMLDSINYEEDEDGNRRRRPNSELTDEEKTLKSEIMARMREMLGIGKREEDDKTAKEAEAARIRAENEALMARRERRRQSQGQPAPAPVEQNGGGDALAANAADVAASMGMGREKPAPQPEPAKKAEGPKLKEPEAKSSKKAKSALPPEDGDVTFRYGDGDNADETDVSLDSPKVKKDNGDRLRRQAENEERARGMKNGKYADPEREAKFQEYRELRKKRREGMRDFRDFDEDELRRDFEVWEQDERERAKDEERKSAAIRKDYEEKYGEMTRRYQKRNK